MPIIERIDWENEASEQEKSPIDFINWESEVSSGQQTGVTSEGLAVGVSKDSPIEIDQAVKTPTATVDAADVGTMVKANFVDDPKTQMAIYASDRFPDEPIDSAMKRYKEVNGKVAFTTGEKLADGQLKYYFEKPDSLGGKVEKFIAAIPSHGPEAIMSAIGGMAGFTSGTAAGGPMLGAAGGVSGATVGAAGGEAYRKTIGGLLFDEPQTVKGNLESIYESGKAAAIGEVVGLGVGAGWNKFLTKKVVADIGNLDEGATNALMSMAKKHGIDLTPAEATGLQSLISRQELLRDLPASADRIQKFLNTRSDQVRKAALNLFEDIAPKVKSPERAYRGGIEAANRKHEQLILRRHSKTNRIYKEAFSEQKNPADLKPVIDKLEGWRNIGTKEDLVGGATKEQEAMIDNILSELTVESPVAGMGQTNKTSVEALHQVKLKIDKMIDAIPESPSAKQKFDDRILNDVKKSLVAQMGKASPKYEKARALFEKLSGPIDEFSKTFAKDIGSLDPKKAKRVGAILFGETSSPLEIKHARSMISSVDPQAWNGVVRGYLEQVFNKGLKDSSIGATGNIGGMYRKAIFGNKDVRSKLRAALTPQQYKGVSDLMTVLEATGKAFKQQSNTMPRQVAKESMEAESTALLSIVDIAATPTQPLNAMVKTLRTLSLEDYARKQAAILTSPTALADLKKAGSLLKELSPREKGFLPALMSGMSVIIEQNLDE